jgi:hypothetical protein
MFDEDASFPGAAAGEESRGTTDVQDPDPIGTSTSSHDLRKRVFDAVVRDLLGPADGPEEEFAGAGVRDRYLLGQLLPRGSVAEPELYDDITRAGESGGEEGQPDAQTPPARTLMPSSLGLTFCIDGDVESVIVKASWGRYRRTKSEVLLTESGAARTVWKRASQGGELRLVLEPGHSWHPIDARYPDVRLEATIRRLEREGGADWVVTVFLINGQIPTEDAKDEEAWLFQPELRIEAIDGAPIFRKRPTPLEFEDLDALDAEEREVLAMQYRNHVEFAVGHGVGVHAEVDGSDPQRARSVSTRIVPWYDVPTTEAPTGAEIPGLDALVRDMKELSGMPTPELVATLSVIPLEYERWIESQVGRANSPQLTSHSDAVGIALSRCRRTLERLREGIRTIEKDPRAADAFRFANKAMWLQRIRSEYAMGRRRGEDADLATLDRPEIRSWYPFQLAYILIAITSLVEPSHRERVDPTAAIADLLWFPTGGGKTEAYLGVAAFAMAIRRLQAGVGGFDSGSGVAVIMRYTLRLLTIQQFQRASTLLCAMEVIRREAVAAGDATWGVEPFRIGLWVGARATPNTTRDAEEAIRNAHRDTWSGGGGGTPHQLPNCPWCGAKIEPGRDLVVDTTLQRTLTYCSDPLGRCEFSRRRAMSEGLPVVVVDEEIYRLLPALLIGTVDKFAQMPWKGEVATLFGRVTGRCLRHGFLNAESAETGRHPKKGELPAVQPVELGPLRPPDLVIQDELHLISGPLGTMVGLYEAAVDELCTWQLAGVAVRPKVVASTATIRRARDQVHALFLRAVEVFPPSGFDVDDNFFSRRRPITASHPGRRYFGICAPGKSRPAVLIRVYVALLAAAQNAYQEHGLDADPWMTLVGYFNSLRELGGMRRLVEDDVSTRTLRVNREEDLPRPGLSGRQLRIVEELTSRRASADIPRILDWLEEKFDPAVEAERAAARERKERGKRRPIDVLLATNMVSVGVDVRRLGLMVVGGQPKNTAEYIQATSRVGRASPGLVCTVLNWARPRDLSHYERFEHFHATFYQFVEALSVTPFAPRALDRGLTGLLVSLLRLEEKILTPNSGAGRLERTASYTDGVVQELSRRAWNTNADADLKQLVIDTLEDRLDQWAHEAEMPGRSLGYRPARNGSTAGLLLAPGAGRWESFTVLNSLRDVEPPVNLIKVDRRTAGHLPDWEAPPDENGAEE